MYETEPDTSNRDGAFRSGACPGPNKSVLGCGPSNHPCRQSSDGQLAVEWDERLLLGWARSSQLCYRCYFDRSRRSVRLEEQMVRSKAIQKQRLYDENSPKTP